MAQRDDLGCDAQAIAYDFDRKIGMLKMRDGNCCDMEGCIEFFKAIDPEIRRIETFSGEVPDTVYALTGNSWNAITPRTTTS